MKDVYVYNVCSLSAERRLSVGRACIEPWNKSNLMQKNGVLERKAAAKLVDYSLSK
jgi:hypothetical protein